MKRQKEIDERIENAKMRLIKWEKIWNDYRKWKNGEREREREQQMILTMTTSRIEVLFFKMSFLLNYLIIFYCLT